MLAAETELLGRYRGAYDPLGFTLRYRPLLAPVGYHPGMGEGNVTSDTAIVRKRGELAAASYYLLPA